MKKMVTVKERVVQSRETEMKNVEEVKEEGAEDMVLRWEKFLTKMELRVLLVEADDSTRHIITALLKKCSYKVDAFSDGLKAWEILNRKSDSIDLILTEVEVPSISGFSLLSLVTEHEACRNIPVIMMSAQDSVSTVYNCMLKGAADFLMKPIRKNELNNLWQHVWRRQALSSGQARTASDAQQMVEAAAEKDAISNYSSGYEACSTQRHRECIQKGSNSQVLQDSAADHQCEDAILTTETFDYNIVQDKSPREAIDLIGSFDTYPDCSYRSLDPTYGLNKLDSSFLLELSLNLSHPKGSLNQVKDDGHLLKQSEVSAFSPYSSRTLQPLRKSSDGICDQQRGYETDFDKQPSLQAHEYSHDDNTISLTSDRCGIQFPSPQRVIPVTGTAKCASFERVCNVYNNLAPPLFCTQSSQSPLQCPDTSGNHERSIQGDKYCYVNPGIRDSPKVLQYLMDQNVSSASPPMESAKSYESELSKDRVHVPSVSLQQVSGGSCNGISKHYEIINNGSTGTSHAFELVKVAAEDAKEANLIHDEKLKRSIQREAALIKFRLKRKERCFDKKVRYQSRSKLAVQRPRVKGQFVRQALTEAAEVKTDEHSS
ncbi:hypothetical protein DCAR_0626034 [Daucus carota subsp. sativus]|uniref:Two-component response regulator-like APRR5 n=1 Tax=Daucus carota subsp. sativus TaxID=79200 RepID=A0AAF1B7Z0_DAUCS|nr:hypothetical protein DCAR_0626034 [Daucus carota subsp. sativus]